MTWILLPAFLYLLPGQAAEGKVAVIYPQLREPYNKVFDKILEGIVEELDERVVPYRIPAGQEADPSGLDAWIEENSIEAIIGLGRQGYEITRSLHEPVVRIAGALVSSPDDLKEGISVVTMTPAPGVVLRNLKRLAPGVKSISFAYSAKYSGWYVKQIKQVADKLALKINAVPVENVKQSAAFYKEYFSSPLRNDALWLLQDPATIDNGPLLASVMQKAWEHDVIVFSNNPAHVARGALFSHYPASRKLGRQLAVLAIQRIRSPGASGAIIPLRDLRLAVNIRTAEHLGYSYTSRLRSKFDLTFPAPR